ncbi:MAG: hypothetical protein AAF683_04920 [Pseudomonadota bacterium]
MFNAIVFAVTDCGFVPRCALEEIDGGEIRLHKIQRIIEQCKFGIHDLSNMELDSISGLPRFNMPLELGLFMGAKRFGEGGQRSKRLIVLDIEKYRYQKAISDISGQDVDAHNGDPEIAIRRVRDWLKTVSKRRTIPGANFVIKRYRDYELDYPAICAGLKYDQHGLPFNDLWETMVEWEKLNALR